MGSPTDFRCAHHRRDCYVCHLFRVTAHRTHSGGAAQVCRPVSPLFLLGNITSRIAEHPLYQIT